MFKVTGKYPNGAAAVYSPITTEARAINLVRMLNNQGLTDLRVIEYMPKAAKTGTPNSRAIAKFYAGG
jgi:tRNA A58 N-methylase Trm61